MAILRVKNQYGEWEEVLAIVGPPGKDYVLTESDKQQIAEMAAELVDVPDGPDTPHFEIDNETLVLKDGVLRVNTADEVEQDNTLPITSAAVHTTVGNIELLLSRI